MLSYISGLLILLFLVWSIKPWLSRSFSKGKDGKDEQSASPTHTPISHPI